MVTQKTVNSPTLDPVDGIEDSYVPDRVKLASKRKLLGADTKSVSNLDSMHTDFSMGHTICCYIYRRGYGRARSQIAV